MQTQICTPQVSTPMIIEKTRKLLLMARFHKQRAQVHLDAHTIDQRAHNGEDFSWELSVTSEEQALECRREARLMMLWLEQRAGHLYLADRDISNEGAKALNGKAYKSWAGYRAGQDIWSN